ncbi:hypothetical protein FM076_18160 [Streptomyces albus subsp. chlorinus]|uniref:hypothetical protein n=1 Tax=Streptomyces albus TaxID=1888 RepID=UPI00156F9089|nr:hypothetical protein [Streptomyces albus]NSC22979.1 hypothetical protein [Streptomyces albus subsp. chlorinus]
MPDRRPRPADSLIADVHDRYLSGRHDNALLMSVREGRASTDQLRRLVAAEAQCHQAEITAYAVMNARFSGPLATDFYLRMSTLVNAARPKLRACAEDLGMSAGDMRLRPRTAQAFSFPGIISWIALQGSQAATALALHTDMRLYFPHCRKLVEELRASGRRVPQSFLDYYASGDSEELLKMAAEVVQEGLEGGDEPRDAVVMAGLVPDGVDDLWRAAAQGSAPDRQRDGVSAG